MSAREKLQMTHKLFTDKHSIEMHDRQVAAVENICDNNYAGFLLQDLESVHPIVTLCNERISQTGLTVFVEPLSRLLKLCMQPFLVTGVVEDQRCAPALALLLKAIARCLYCPVLRVQMTAAEALVPFVHVIDPDQEVEVNPVGARRARLQHEVLDSSGIIPLITSLLQSMLEGAQGTNHHLEGALTRIMRELSASPQGCGMLAESGAIEVLATMLVNDFRDDSVGCAVQVLWNVLELCEPVLWEPVVTPELILYLNDLFGRLLCDGYRDSDKDLRNDVLVVASLCTRVPECLPAFAAASSEDSSSLRSCSMLSLALAGTLYPILGKAHPLLARGRVLQSMGPQSAAGTWHELEMLKWTLNLCARTNTDPACLATMLACGLMDAAMRFLEPGYGGSYSEYTEDAATATGLTLGRTRRPGEGQVPVSRVPAALNGWDPENVRELQLAVLGCLTEVAPRCPEEFALHGGNQTTLTFLLYIAEQPQPAHEVLLGPETTGPARDPAYVNTGGEGGIGSTPSLRSLGLNLLNSICRLPGFKTELGEYGAVPVMIAIVQEPILPGEQGSLGISVEHAIKLRQDALCVLSALCNACEPNQKALARERGIGTLRNLLQFSAQDPDRSETMLVAVLDCLWNAVLGYPRNAARFLALDGVSALLSLLEVTPTVLHGQILGCICDVCEVEEAVPELLAWSSEATGLRAPQVLLKLWMDQEAQLNIAEPGGGYIVNQQRPLAGTGVVQAGYKKELGAMLTSVDDAERRAVGAGTLGSVREAVMAELSSQDVKSKIFCVFCKCGFDGHDFLSSEEQTRLAFVQKYAELKQGEVMEDISRELDAALGTPHPSRNRAHIHAPPTAAISVD
jgi:hypothetical protein